MMRSSIPRLCSTTSMAMRRMARFIRAASSSRFLTFMRARRIAQDGDRARRGLTEDQPKAERLEDGRVRGLPRLLFSFQPFSLPAFQPSFTII